MCLSASPFRAILPMRRCARSPILIALFFCATFLRPEPSIGLAVLSALPRDMDLQMEQRHLATYKSRAPNWEDRVQSAIFRTFHSGASGASIFHYSCTESCLLLQMHI